jgi:hypothetical protein
MTAIRIALTSIVIGTAGIAHGQAVEPAVAVRSDNTRIEHAARLDLPAQPIVDVDHNGVLHITGDDLVIDLDGGTLRGSAADLPPNERAGIGIVVSGERITIRNGRIAGFRVGLKAVDSPGLVLEDLTFVDNFMQRLGSNPEREDVGDWLRPHDNDEGEWTSRYGAAVSIGRSDDVIVRRVTVRRGQNGIILDRVNDAEVYDNDCSFLSGWGLALWRSNRNLITRNALDFCVRGYSHGVYNRGQDSAGILMFEQCSDNIIAQNSATHGGDGFFGFAGQEALGVRPPDGVDEDGLEDWCTGRGNNRNLLIDNDFSYAVAHGIEMTFSFGNRFIANRLVGNGICGVWGGYSQDTRILGNDFERNGELGYGLERGGVNIEHGRGNRIAWNTFRANACGVHLWWDPDEHIMNGPWARANERGSSDNFITHNTFDGDQVALHVRQTVRTRFLANEVRGVPETIRAEESDVQTDGMVPMGQFVKPAYEVKGDSRPVGARTHLRGRDKIIVTPWGPYDWERPALIRYGAETTAEGRPAIRFAELGVDESTLSIESPDADGLQIETTKLAGDVNGYDTRVVAQAPGLYAFTISWEGPEGRTETHAEHLVRADWAVRQFSWTTDPREDAAAWRREGRAAPVKTLSQLHLPWGMGGPRWTARPSEPTGSGRSPRRRCRSGPMRRGTGGSAR